jgi:hypothetical protein
MHQLLKSCVPNVRLMEYILCALSVLCGKLLGAVSRGTMGSTEVLDNAGYYTRSTARTGLIPNVLAESFQRDEELNEFRSPNRDEAC